MEHRVDFAQFKKLLDDLERSQVRIRLRPSGERWMEFSKVLLVSETSVICEESTRRQVIMDLGRIVEFAIDQGHHGYLENTPYVIDQG